jgi:predicted dinucleotide-utilizing enzyme
MRNAKCKARNEKSKHQIYYGAFLDSFKLFPEEINIANNSLASFRSLLISFMILLLPKILSNISSQYTVSLASFSQIDIFALNSALLMARFAFYPVR